MGRRGSNFSGPGGHHGGYLDNLRLQSMNAAASGNIARALDLARRYHACLPDDVGVLDHLAHMHQKLGDFAGVIKYGRRSYELEPVAKHLGILVEAYFKLGRFEPLVNFCGQELKRLGWKGSVRNPRCTYRLLRAIAYAGYYLRTRRKAERRALREQERRRREEDARRATAALQPAAHQPAAPPASVVRAPAPPPEWPAASPPPVSIEVQVDAADLASDLAGVDRAGQADRAPCLELTQVYVKHDGIPELFAAHFQPLNVRLEFKDVHEGFSEFLGVGLYYEAHMLEHNDGVIEVWLNTDTGAMLEFPPHMLDDARPCTMEQAARFKPVAPKELVALAQAAASGARELVEERLRPALRHVQGELDAEFAELQASHRDRWNATVDSMKSPAANPRRVIRGEPPSVRPDRHEGEPSVMTAAPVQAPPVDSPDADARGAPCTNRLERELSRQREAFQHAAGDLAARRRTHVRLVPMDLRRVRLPVMWCSVQMTRRQSSRTLLIPYNPLLHGLEPLSCSRCRRNTFALGATDAVELLCSRCLKH